MGVGGSGAEGGGYREGSRHTAEEGEVLHNVLFTLPGLRPRRGSPCPRKQLESSNGAAGIAGIYAVGFGMGKDVLEFARMRKIRGWRSFFGWIKIVLTLYTNSPPFALPKNNTKVKISTAWSACPGHHGLLVPLPHLLLGGRPGGPSMRFQTDASMPGRVQRKSLAF